MVAVYIPVLQVPSPNSRSFTQASPINNNPAQPCSLNISDSKITFFLRALHAHNKAKDDRITCLGNAVTCNRRCRNPLYYSKWAFAVVEMIEAAEDRGVYLADLKGDAEEWAKDFACYLHGGQKGVKMAVLGAIAVYRMEMDGGMGTAMGLGLDGVKRLPSLEGKDYWSVNGRLEPVVVKEEADEKAGMAVQEWLAQIKIEEQLREIRQKEKTLELAEKERVLLLCEKAMLLVKSLKLKGEMSTLIAGKKACVAE